ncbi:phenol hydroxylase subunit P4 [Pseudomonas sp. JS3066]|uniref:phenol hydroxylase subunit P4 n=1 Tax=unclassified Pseudomonas TaxID=196821 RepID=UPI000EA93DB9|nr:MULTISPECIES: phenol hydroxylase subunit P4 [unclassified Pseudomonas]AYF88657.1 phenol hydroxylase [Pseudomonas sp. DY-1]MDH4653106.1 phenol hydroxylase [Pseudomonas sp. BN606]MRK21769.1 phenol hydroxylase [Pseudomonas sp. JG-B]WVK93805.1 phenol hydroxylase subunit P4 [Pseudomonas sp. JS3066]
MPVTAIGAYAAQSLDRQENFNGLQLVYLCWERHLMFCAPFTLPLPPDMPFADFIEQVVKPAIAAHPDAAKVDFAKASWRLDDTEFQPDLTTGLAANGIGHKSLLRLFTPGLDGLNGSFN